MTASVPSLGCPNRSSTTLETRIMASLSRTVPGSRDILSMKDSVTAAHASSFMGKSYASVYISPSVSVLLIQSVRESTTLLWMPHFSWAIVRSSAMRCDLAAK